MSEEERLYDTLPIKNFKQRYSSPTTRNNTKLVLPDSEKPRICVTFGSTASAYTWLDLFYDLWNSKEFDFFLLGRVPSQRYIGDTAYSIHYKWAPIEEILSECELVIHHGGSGTMFSSFLRETPQIAILISADSSYNGDVIERSGAGKSLELREIDSAELRRNIHSILSDPSMREKSQQLKNNILEMNTPGQTAREITGYLNL